MSSYTIDPRTYHDDALYRETADRIIAKAGVDLMDVAKITVEDGVATLLLYLSDDNGKHYLIGDNIATRIVQVSA